MTKIKDGGPAFPRAPFTFADRQSGLDWSVTEQPGMTLRQYYAGQLMANSSLFESARAMGAMAVTVGGMKEPLTFEIFAEYCCRQADAILAELEKVKP